MTFVFLFMNYSLSYLLTLSWKQLKRAAVLSLVIFFSNCTVSLPNEHIQGLKVSVQQCMTYEKLPEATTGIPVLYLTTL